MKRLNSNAASLMVVAFVICCASWAEAACSWSGNTGTVASPYGVTDVAACVTDASSKTGAVVIQIPDSSVTWASGLAVNMRSGFTNVTSLTIRGQNDCSTTNTTHMFPSGANFAYPTSCGTNIANMTLSYTGIQGKAFRLAHLRATGTSGVHMDGDGKSWRFDHIFWDNVTGANSNRVYYITKSASNLDWLFEGLIDHNNAVILSGGPSIQFVFSSIWGNAEWMAPFGLGASSAVYVENNRVTFQSGTSALTDNNGGSRYVFRYNEFTNGYLGGHEGRGYSSGMRGSRKSESYGNYFDITAGTNCWLFYMAGNGVFFNNTVSGTAGLCDARFMLHLSRKTDVGGCSGTSGNDILASATDYPRGTTCTLGVGGCIKMDGSGSPDGYPCRDQYGVSGNNPQIGGGAPFYVWGNTFNGGALGVATDTDGYIVANRDYYVSTASFNGSSGVGTGTKAAMPATCTTGVAYWVTDEGGWNSTTANPGGVLYKCTATNTWTLYYTPYTYPHPLQGTGALTPPLTPGPVFVQ
jgi:hypothetical protein